MDYDHNNPNPLHDHRNHDVNPIIPVITVDGPSGSGKGTLSLMLAKALGWHFLDSGAIYRTLAFCAEKHQIDLQNEKKLQNLALNLQVEFNEEILLEGEIVTSDIRTEYWGNMASKIATFPSVRQALLERQRFFCKPPGLVADGRDMGTVVFPKAQLKIFLLASKEERAKRRYLQLKDTVHNVTLQSLLAEIEGRDERDTLRAVAPLKPAKDAMVIDTTALGIKAVFDQVMTKVKHVFINF